MYLAHKLIKYFVPQLTICVIFAPLKSKPPSKDEEFEETDTLSWANRPVSRYSCGMYVVLQKLSLVTKTISDAGQVKGWENMREVTENNLVESF